MLHIFITDFSYHMAGNTVCNNICRNIAGHDTACPNYRVITDSDSWHNLCSETDPDIFTYTDWKIINRSISEIADSCGFQSVSYFMATLHNSARSLSQNFCPNSKFRKWRNTVCISHFWNCGSGAKRRLRIADTIVRCCLISVFRKSMGISPAKYRKQENND